MKLSKTTKTFAKLINIFIILAIVFSFWAGLARAETTVVVEDCKIKVTVNIAIYGPGADQAYANKVKQAAEKKWNDAHIKAGECKCELDLTVNVKVVQNCNDPKAKNHHCLKVNNVPAGAFHRSAVSGVAGQMKPTGASFDPNAPHVASGTGELGSNDTDNVIAHEVGHLMGLEDDYDEYYQYYYANPDGSVAAGPFFIKKSDFTAAKKTEMEANAPPGTTLTFAANPNYGGNIWSLPRPGKENSLMAGIGANATPQDSHAEDILGDAKLKCPDECCCGDGQIQKDKKEECDPKAIPSGCKEPEEGCAKNCKCVKVTPICGDGAVTPPEECDPKATPTGCSPAKDCVGCKCKEKEASPPPPAPSPSPEQPAQPPEEPVGQPPEEPPSVPFCGDTKITAPEQCDSTATPVGCNPGYECINCNCIFIETTPPAEKDSDNDGVKDNNDNCPSVANPDQADQDSDGIGDVCDSCTDRDKDGFATEGGNCGPSDCDDEAANISPGAGETCGDGIDNNCNGEVDEDCAPAPSLDVLPPLLAFDPSTPALPLSIINTGGGVLSWRILPNLPSWLKAFPMSGSISGADQLTIWISIQKENIKPGKSYNHLLKITSNGGSKEIPVTLMIE